MDCVFVQSPVRPVKPQKNQIVKLLHSSGSSTKKMKLHVLHVEAELTDDGKAGLKTQENHEGKFNLIIVMNIITT